MSATSWSRVLACGEGVKSCLKVPCGGFGCVYITCWSSLTLFLNLTGSVDKADFFLTSDPGYFRSDSYLMSGCEDCCLNSQIGIHVPTNNLNICQYSRDVRVYDVTAAQITLLLSLNACNPPFYSMSLPNMNVNRQHKKSSNVEHSLWTAVNQWGGAFTSESVCFFNTLHAVTRVSVLLGDCWWWWRARKRGHVPENVVMCQQNH